MDDHSFKPAWWLPSPHLQTLWPALFRRKIKDLKIKEERLETPDGDFLDLGWVGEKGPIIIVLHGLEGSIESPYAFGMLHAIQQQGWRGLFMHFRGCSGEPNRLPHSYHSGETKDISYIVETVSKNHPDTPLAAIGFSLGGNMLLKWLGETGPSNKLCAAIAVSVPFELIKVVNRFQKGFSRLYQYHLLSCLRKRLIQKFKGQKAPIDIPALHEIKTMLEFDEQITVPLHGFKSVDDYYNIASSRNYLKNIEVPTLLLHAKDDPFMSQDIIPEPHELSDKIQIEVTPTGGHVGFVSGRFPWKTEYWLEKRVPMFLNQYF